MKRITLTVLLLVAGCLAFAEFANVAICDGWYDLVVDIAPELSADAESVAFVGANNADVATSFGDAVDDMLPHFDKSDSTETLTLNVGFSYRASGLLGRTWGHVQEYSHVVVVISHSDGTRDVYIAPVPHRDDSKHIVVTAACAAQHGFYARLCSLIPVEQNSDDCKIDHRHLVFNSFFISGRNCQIPAARLATQLPCVAQT